MLQALGFAAVRSLFPRKAPLGSSSLAWSEDSNLVDLSPAELLAAFDAVEVVRRSFQSATGAPRSPTCGAGCPEKRGERRCLARLQMLYLDWNRGLALRRLARATLPVWEFEHGKTVRDG